MPWPKLLQSTAQPNKRSSVSLAVLIQPIRTRHRRGGVITAQSRLQEFFGRIHGFVSSGNWAVTQAVAFLLSGMIASTATARRFQG